MNEAFTELHVTLAETKFSDEHSEINRNDVLHLIVAKPIKYLIAGFHLTRTAVRNRVIGVIFTMCLFIFRLIILLVLENAR